RLRAAEEFISRGDHERGALAQRRPRIGLIGKEWVRAEQARADIGDDGNPRLPSKRVDPHPAGEALDEEVRGMHLEHETGSRIDRVRVIAQVGSVRRADLADLYAR